MAFIRENHKHLFGLFVPLFFIVFQQSIENRHSHISPNGMVISHSHPLNPDNAGEDHTHSRSEICFYFLVNFEFFSSSTEFYVNFKTDNPPPSIYVFGEQLYRGIFLDLPVNRGPPIV